MLHLRFCNVSGMSYTLFFIHKMQIFLTRRHCVLYLLHCFTRIFALLFVVESYLWGRCKVQTNNLALSLVEYMFHCSASYHRTSYLGHFYQLALDFVRKGWKTGTRQRSLCTVTLCSGDAMSFQGPAVSSSSRVKGWGYMGMCCDLSGMAEQLDGNS